VTPFLSYSNRQGLLHKVVNAGTGACVFAWAWVVLGQFQPNTIHAFPFSFSIRIREFIENCTKMLKILDQFCYIPKFL
jgi:hypothetical protein